MHHHRFAVWAVPALVLALVGAPSAAQAQTPISVEVRPGVTLPVSDLSDSGSEAGLSIGGEAMLTFRRNLTAYVGASRHGFSCPNGCAIGDNPRSTGLNAGLKYILYNPGDAHLWTRGGVVAHELTTDEGSSSRELGFEVGTGVDMPIRNNLYVVPSLGFVSHSTGGDFSATYVTFGAGIHYHVR